MATSNSPTEMVRVMAASLLATGSFKAALVADTWQWNRGSTEYRSSWQAHEVTGTNWPAGGVAVTNTVTADKNNHIVTITYGGVTVANVTVANVRYLVRYKVVGSASTDLIVLVTDLGATTSWSNQTLEIEAMDQLMPIGPDR